jgi:sugar phosphate isomerase/epimerase
VEEQEYIMQRRDMLAVTLMGGLSGATAWSAPRTKMTMQLDCGSIGVKATPPQALEYAKRYGFDSISADSGWLAGLPAEELQRFLAEMKSKQIVWGNAGLPVEFRKEEAEFRSGVAELKRRAPALQRAGVKRVTTWILPASDTMTYLENLKFQAKRLVECASILADYGCAFGLEYVGPKTAWTARRYPFVHSMREMRDLIAEIGKPNVGFVMDSWHWYTAGDTAEDLKTLKASEVISIDLNDAPSGVAWDQQVDSKREIPCATGVIQMATFLNGLNAVGCDAPARCEPFNAALRAMAPEQALETTATAMKKAFALIS